MSSDTMDICWSALLRWGPSLKNLNTHLGSVAHVGLSWANLTLDGLELVWEWAGLFAHLPGHCQ